MNFKLEGTKTLYLYQCEDYCGNSGLTDLETVIRNSDQLYSYIQYLIDKELQARQEQLKRNGNLDGRCSSLYLLSERLTWSSAIIFEEVNGRIEANSVKQHINKEYGYTEEIKDEYLLEELYKYAISQLDISKMSKTACTKETCTNAIIY